MTESTTLIYFNYNSIYSNTAATSTAGNLQRHDLELHLRAILDRHIPPRHISAQPGPTQPEPIRQHHTLGVDQPQRPTRVLHPLLHRRMPLPQALQPRLLLLVHDLQRRKPGEETEVPVAEAGRAGTRRRGAERVGVYGEIEGHAAAAAADFVGRVSMRIYRVIDGGGRTYRFRRRRARGHP